MVTYHNIAKFVAPKTDSLLKAEKSLQVANKKLAAAMEDLAVCQGELDAMTVQRKACAMHAMRAMREMCACNHYGLHEYIGMHRAALL